MIKNFIVLMMAFFSTASYAQGFTLSSQQIHGQLAIAQVFNSFGCTGKNISPQLSWQNAPTATKSFAITAYDPDAPTGSGWWHWVVFNVPKTIHHLKTGASRKTMPAGAVESITSFGTQGYGGACPPKGDKPHRYIFTVFALDIKKLKQTATTRPELIGFIIHNHVLAKASIMAYYAR